jgi:hypothetical protein
MSMGENLLKTDPKRGMPLSFAKEWMDGRSRVVWNWNTSAQLVARKVIRKCYQATVDRAPYTPTAEEVDATLDLEDLDIIERVEWKFLMKPPQNGYIVTWRTRAIIETLGLI